MGKKKVWIDKLVEVKTKDEENVTSTNFLSLSEDIRLKQSLKYGKMSEEENFKEKELC